MMLDTYTTTGRAIARCGACKTAGQINYSLRTDSYEAPRGMRYESTVTPDGGRPVRVDQTRSNPMGWALHRACPSCGSQNVTVRVVKGTLVESKACNARCLGATGPVCECSCAGENHGGGHGTW